MPADRSAYRPRPWSSLRQLIKSFVRPHDVLFAHFEFTTVSGVRSTVQVSRSISSDSIRKGGMPVAKPSKSSLSKAGKTLASKGSSKPSKSKAGSTLGKG